MKKRVTLDNCSVATLAHSTTAPSQSQQQNSTAGSSTRQKLPPLTREQRVSNLVLRRLQKLHDRSQSLEEEVDASSEVEKVKQRKSPMPNTSSSSSAGGGGIGNTSAASGTADSVSRRHDALGLVMAAYNSQIAHDAAARRSKKKKQESSCEPTSLSHNRSNDDDGAQPTTLSKEEKDEEEAVGSVDNSAAPNCEDDHDEGTSGGGGGGNADAASAQASALLPGMVLSLAEIPMTAQDLIPVVEFLSNGNAKIRSLSLLGLETPLGLAKQTANLLVKLLSRQRSIVELHISDTCQLGTVQILQLQQALDENIQAAVRAEQKRQDIRELRAQEREEQRQQDVMDFYYWENSNRMGLMQLQNSQRTDLTKHFHARLKVILSGAQKTFTSALQEQERQRALQDCQGAKQRFSLQWEKDVWYQLLLSARCAEEAVWREHINAELTAALDELHLAKRDHHRQSKMAERNRADRQLSERAKLMIEERHERNKLSGKHLGHYVACKMLAVHIGLLPSRLASRAAAAAQKQQQQQRTAQGTATATKSASSPASDVPQGTSSSQEKPFGENTDAISGEIKAVTSASVCNGHDDDDDEIDEALDERLRQSLADMKKRSIAGTEPNDDAATKLASIVRAKSLGSQRLSLFPDLADDHNLQQHRPTTTSPNEPQQAAADCGALLPKPQEDPAADLQQQNQPNDEAPGSTGASPAVDNAEAEVPTTATTTVQPVDDQQHPDNNEHHLEPSLAPQTMPDVAAAGAPQPLAVQDEAL